MTERDVEDSPRRRRHVPRLLIPARSVLTGTGLVVAYYLIPMDRPFTAATIVGLVIGLTLVVGLLAWQTVKITRSDYPRLRAVETITSVFSLFIVLFATFYFLMERNAAGSFSQAMSRTDALYFTITTFATVGYGDIVPATQEAKVAALVQMLGDLLLVGVALKVILEAVQTGLSRGGRAAVPKGGHGPPTPAGPSGNQPGEGPEPRE